MALAPSLAVVRIEGTGSVDTFIWGSIEVNEEFVDGFLVFDIKSSLDQSRRNDIIDIGNSLGHTWRRKSESHWVKRIYPCQAKQSPCHAIQAPRGHRSRHPKAQQHDAVPSLHEEFSHMTGQCTGSRLPVIRSTSTVGLPRES
jgi:hypothetical protein